jgi:prophage regulatory protein
MEHQMRLIDRKGLAEKGLTYSKTHLDRLVQAGKFPKPIQLQDNGKNHWNEEEIDALIELLAQRERV